MGQQSTDTEGPRGGWVYYYTTISDRGVGGWGRRGRKTADYEESQASELGHLTLAAHSEILRVSKLISIRCYSLDYETRVQPMNRYQRGTT